VGNATITPALIVSLLVTVIAGCYAYVYLPIAMRKAYRQSLRTLSRVVETKDTGAEGRGERVAAYAVQVAKELRVPAKERQKIEYAAFLQDIGNVRVPHKILNKTQALSPKEFEIVKQHTLVGAEMVGQVKFLSDIAPIIRHHHECWDGSGYPDGLKGKEIPLGSRILAVCTAYDSMTRERAFRHGMDKETAIRELRAGSGTKYDPEVVRAFLKVLKKQEK
jgi:HD-GYP domain-containing protein (c-di-GMP phosphodiesterase class II)